MSSKNGGSAYPWTMNNNCIASSGGMSLRDAFAIAAMQGDLASSSGGCHSRLEEIAEFAYRVADAMLKAREPGGDK